VTTLEHSLRLDFSPQQTYYYLGVAQDQLGDHDAALQSYERCFTRFVDEVVYFAYADLAARTGKLSEAREKIDLLLASNPPAALKAKARYIDAAIEYEEKNYAAALEKFQKLAADVPTFEAARIALGNLYATRGQTQEARAEYERALRLIETSLASAEKKLTSPAGLTTAQYGELRGLITSLRSERDFVQERLRALPAS
jgi:tetratricopeptide (TPR) repeat protein